MEMAKLQLEKEKLELEKAMKQQELDARLQMEKEKFELEKELKQKELDAKIKLEQEKLEKQGSSGVSTHSVSDVTKNIRLVPKFEEKEVDKYFLHFEKIAESLKWPKESWTLLLQSVFVKKAREIYSSLSLNNVKIRMQFRKQFSRLMSWCPRLTGRNSEVQRKSQVKLTLSLLDLKSKCLIGGSVLRM